MQETNHATTNSATGRTQMAPPSATDLRTLGELPWITTAGAPVAKPTSTKHSPLRAPLFDFAPHSLDATPDRDVCADHTSPTPAIERPAIATADKKWRIDSTVAVETERATPLAAELPATLATTITNDEYIAPDAVPGKTPRGANLPIEEPDDSLTPGWVEIALALHTAVAPHLRWLLLIAMFAAAGLMLLAMRDARVDPRYTPPHDFVPIADIELPASSSLDEPPLFESVANVDEIDIASMREATPHGGHRPLSVSTTQPKATTRPKTTLTGPSVIARGVDTTDQQQFPSWDTVDTQVVAAPSTPHAYPTTGLNETTSFAPVARLSQQIFPVTEQGQHEDHQSSIR